MSTILPDPATPFGERVARRLRDEVVIWLTTTGADGTPQPNPVWFLWDGQTFLVYNQPTAKRLAHVKRNPRVALNFDGNRRGGDIIIITGTARISEQDPTADRVPAYLEKYRELVAGLGMEPAAFAASYSVALRIEPHRVRGE